MSSNQNYAPYTYGAPQQQPPAGGFDLDDLLEGSSPAGQRQSIPPAPSYPPPPPVNHDPFDFLSGGKGQQQQQPAAPPQQQPGYGQGYGNQQHLQQYQPQPAAGYPQHQPQQYQQPSGAASQQQQQQPPQHTYTPPQQQGLQPPAAYNQQPQQGEYHQPQQQQPHQHQSWAQPQNQPAAQQQLQQQRQQQPYASEPYTYAPPSAIQAGAVPAPVAPYTQAPQQQGYATYGYQPSASTGYSSGSDAIVMPPFSHPGLQQHAPSQPSPPPQPSFQPGWGAPPTGASFGAASGSPLTAEEAADRQHLEQLQRLRKELEREQERERMKKQEKDTWQCSQCTFRNKLSINKCEMCETPRPGFAAQQQQQQQQPARAPAQDVQAYGQPERQSTPPQNGLVKEGNWSCPVCTLHNPVERPACQACDTPRPAHIRAPAPQVVSAVPMQQPSVPSNPAYTQQPSAKWNCPQCTFENTGTAAKCQMCEYLNPNARGGSTPPPRSNYPSAAVPPASNQPSRVPGPPGEDDVQWQDDKFATNCNKCNAPFGVVTRKHHCRICGFVFCGNCTANRMKVKPTDKVESRVCIDCFRAKSTLV